MLRISFTFFWNLFALQLIAQSTDAFIFQTSIRNNFNKIIINKPIKLRITILQGSPTGNSLFSEVHTATTNSLGIASVRLGQGTNISGNLNTIDWYKGLFYIKSEADADNGSNFSSLVITQLLHTPSEKNNPDKLTDLYSPIAFANSSFLSPGQELEITAGLGKFSKSMKPMVSINGENISINNEGVAKYKMNVGNNNGSVPIKFQYKDQQGNNQVRNLKIDYIVSTQSEISLSVEKVKILYLGLDNELLITCGNILDENISVSIDNGNIFKKGGGKYIVSPTAPGIANIRVNVEGKTKVYSVKVKSVPDPTPMVGSSSGGRMAANVFKAQEGIRADLKDFIFEGVKFEIISYTFYATGAGFQLEPGVQAGIKGNRFDSIQDLISKCRPGTTVVLDEIKVLGPDGSTRKLQTIAFNLY